MNDLDGLTQQQKQLVYSLPYRAGLWVSQSDSSGGVESDEKELRALANIIEGFTGEVFGSEIVQHIMAGTMQNREKWKDWSRDIEQVPQECEQAVDILLSHFDIKEVSAFKLRLMEIGEAVAMAFREVDENTSSSTKMHMYMLFVITKIGSIFKSGITKTFDEFMNISLEERKALTELARALQTDYVA